MKVAAFPSATPAPAEMLICGTSSLVISTEAVPEVAKPPLPMRVDVGARPPVP